MTATWPPCRSTWLDQNTPAERHSLGGRLLGIDDSHEVEPARMKVSRGQRWIPARA